MARAYPRETVVLRWGPAALPTKSPGWARTNRPDRGPPTTSVSVSVSVSVCVCVRVCVGVC
eukprot:14300712-Alexandrium_andersonii.AAC.1